MDQAAFERFIDFVELAQRIDRLSQEATDMAKHNETLLQQIDSIKAETEAAFQKAHELKKEVDVIELELNVLNEKRREKQAKLGAAKTPKEFFSFEHELEDLSKKQAVLDEKGFELIERLEAAQQEYEKHKGEESERLHKLETLLAEQTKEIQYLDQLKNALIKKSNEDELLVPDDMLARYKAMKEQVPNPVVPIIKGSCSACFYTVRQADRIEAQQGNVVTCRDCYRLLYIRPIEEEHGKQPSV